MISEDEILETTTKGEIAYPILLVKQVDRIAQARSNVSYPNINRINLRGFISTVDTLEKMLAPYHDNDYKKKEKVWVDVGLNPLPKKHLLDILDVYDEKFCELMKLMQRKNFLVEERAIVTI